MNDPAPKAPTVPPLNFTSIFNDYIASTQKKWGHDRLKTVGASEVFACIRKAWYKRNNTPVDPDYKESWGATRRGDLIENYHVVPAMQHGAAKVGFKLDYAGEEQQTLFSTGAPLSVTPDGLLHGLARNALALYGIDDIESDCCMFEIKSIDPRVNLAEEKAIHNGQTIAQMGTVRETTKFRPVYAVILYVNASFFDDMSVFVVKWDEERFKAAKARAEYVFECDDPAKLQREGIIDGSCQYCPYQASCMATTIAGMPKNDKKIAKGKTSKPEHVTRMQDLVLRSREMGRLKKKAEKDYETVREDIKVAMREIDERQVRDSNWLVSYSMCSGKEGIDKVRLETILDGLREIVAANGLNQDVDKLLKAAGVDEDNDERNELRLLDMDAVTKRGSPYEILRTTYTEPEADDL